MIFTVDQHDIYSEHYIKDDKGLIIGCAKTTQQGWFAQSCLHAASITSWSNPEGPFTTKMEAVNAAIADYIARRME